MEGFFSSEKWEMKTIKVGLYIFFEIYKPILKYISTYMIDYTMYSIYMLFLILITILPLLLNIFVL